MTSMISCPPPRPATTPRPNCRPNSSSAPMATAWSVGAGRDDFDQRDGEEDRHRVVGAQLHLQGRAHPIANGDAADPQQKEHGGGVGRTHDRSEKERMQPRQSQQVVGGHTHQAGGHDHAERRQHHRRPERRAYAPDLRVETAVEENDRERDRTDEVGDPGIVEPDATQAVLARQQAHGEKHQQQRGADAEGDEAGEGRNGDQPRADQNRKVHRLEHRRPSSFAASMSLARDIAHSRLGVNRQGTRRSAHVRG